MNTQPKNLLKMFGTLTTLIVVYYIVMFSFNWLTFQTGQTILNLILYILITSVVFSGLHLLFIGVSNITKETKKDKIIGYVSALAIIVLLLVAIKTGVTINSVMKAETKGFVTVGLVAIYTIISNLFNRKEKQTNIERP